MESIKAHEYTRIAEVKLRKVEQNEKIRKAIYDGDQEEYIRVMEYASRYEVTWGDHIKRYIYEQMVEKDPELKIENMSDDFVMDFIKRAFKDNGMTNRGSMEPDGTTKLGNRLPQWMKSRVTSIERKTCFLFGFGLNMDVEQVKYMLTHVLRQDDFNARDYKEVIYYWCFKQNLQYEGVVTWLNKYKNIQAEAMTLKNAEPKTDILQNELLSIQDEAGFVKYLTRIKRLSCNSKRSRTQANELKWLSTQLVECLSCEEYSYVELAECLNRVWVDNVQIPKIIEKMVEDKVISLPSLSNKFLGKRISWDEANIQRNEILTLVFLFCAYNLNMEEKEGVVDYAERKANFVYEANTSLEYCGFDRVSLLNPYEMFLVSCLLQKSPFEYFVAVWKKYHE